MAKVNFLNQDESFMSESYISQRRGNAHKKKTKNEATLFREQ